MRHRFKTYCKDYKNIENYEMAAADNFVGWVCHHRLQTWTSDGKRREVDILAKELKALGMYYNRPASELIFLTKSEHSTLHNTGKKYCLGKAPWNKGLATPEKTRKKISEANKGIAPWNKGKHHSEETKKKIGTALKGHKNNLGKRHSEEHNKKIGAASVGKHWYNNGIENKFCYECPEGFFPGMLLRKK